MQRYAWGCINLNGKITLYFFTENIYCELCINILKEKLPEMKRVVNKIFILVRDNTSAYISEAKLHFIKERGLMN